MNKPDPEICYECGGPIDHVLDPEVGQWTLNLDEHEHLDQPNTTMSRLEKSGISAVEEALLSKLGEFKPMRLGPPVGVSVI